MGSRAAARAVILACALATWPALAGAQASGGSIAVAAGYCHGGFGAVPEVEGGICLNVQLLNGSASDWRTGLNLSSAWLDGRPDAGTNQNDYPAVHAADIALVVQRHWKGWWTPYIGAGFGIVSARQRDIEEPQTTIAPVVLIEAGTSIGAGRVRPAARFAYDWWLSDFNAQEGSLSRVVRFQLGVEVGFGLSR